MQTPVEGTILFSKPKADAHLSAYAKDLILFRMHLAEIVDGIGIDEEVDETIEACITTIDHTLSILSHDSGKSMATIIDEAFMVESYDFQAGKRTQTVDNNHDVGAMKNAIRKNSFILSEFQNHPNKLREHCELFGENKLFQDQVLAACPGDRRFLLQTFANTVVSASNLANIVASTKRIASADLGEPASNESSTDCTLLRNTLIAAAVGAVLGVGVEALLYCGCHITFFATAGLGLHLGLGAAVLMAAGVLSYLLVEAVQHCISNTKKATVSHVDRGETEAGEDFPSDLSTSYSSS